MPCRQYIDKNFRAESLQLIQHTNTVISEYKAQGYELTLRQVYYQLVSRNIIPNNERSYKNLGNLISDARLAGLIDWNAIEDRTRNIRTLPHWNSPSNIIESAASSYRKDHWAGQKNYVEVWVEKDALIGIVQQECNKHDVSCFSCRGYVSQSEMWSAAERLLYHANKGQHIILLHLGDHDPSGIDMSRDIVDRLNLFGVDDIAFKRLALNMNQIEEYTPPPNPTKLSDSRAEGYINAHGYECWELDALEPQVISSLIRDNVTRYLDKRMYSAIIKNERDEKALLDDLADNWQCVAENWEQIKHQFAE